MEYVGHLRLPAQEGRPRAGASCSAEVASPDELHRWSSAEFALSKLRALALLIASERLTVCALQEVPTANCVEELAHSGPFQCLPSWSFITSATIGPGLFQVAEAAAFGYDTLAWEPLLASSSAVAVYPGASGPTPAFAFKRAPAVLFLRSRVHHPRVLALVSSHNKADEGGEVTGQVKAEAAALAEHALPWVHREAQARGVVDLGDLAVVFAGDYNLPPGRVGTPWAGLVGGDHSFTPALLTPSCGATNVVAEFTSGGAPHTYDNIFAHVPWVPKAAGHDGVRESRVVDCTHGNYSSAAAYLGTIVQAIKAVRELRVDAAHPDLCALVKRLQSAAGVGEEYRKQEFRNFRAAVSDHRPVCTTICSGIVGRNVAWELLEATVGGGGIQGGGAGGPWPPSPPPPTVVVGFEDRVT